MPRNDRGEGRAGRQAKWETSARTAALQARRQMDVNGMVKKMAKEQKLIKNNVVNKSKAAHGLVSRQPSQRLKVTGTLIGIQVEFLCSFLVFSDALVTMSS